MLHWRIQLFVARMLIFTPPVGWAAYAAIRYWDKLTSNVGIGLVSVTCFLVGMYLDHKASKLRKLAQQ